SDGYFYVGVGSEQAWSRFVHALNMPELERDDRFASNGSRVDNRSALRDILSNVFIGRPVSYWIERLSSAAVPVEPINSVADVLHDPHAQARQAVVPIPGIGGRSLMAGVPIKMDRGLVPPWGEPPLLGQHT